MTPDFLNKVGIEKVSDNLSGRQLKVQPDFLAKLFGDEFLKKIKEAQASGDGKNESLPNR